MIRIAEMTAAHWPAVWAFMEPIFREGASYPTAWDISEAEAKIYWHAEDKTTYVAFNKDGVVVGSFYLRPNQPSLGAHICNAGYLVAPAVRGQGVASAMCEFSQAEAKRQGYLGMQYNLVVSTNQAAVHVWTKMGFDILGTVPQAFAHKDLGLVDAHIMFKRL